MRKNVSLMIAGTVLGLAGRATAQQPAQQPNPYPPLAVGAVAPDFAMSGSTQTEVLKKPIHLSDFKGKTVVLAFYFRARTRG